MVPKQDGPIAKIPKRLCFSQKNGWTVIIGIAKIVQKMRNSRQNDNFMRYTVGFLQKCSPTMLAKGAGFNNYGYEGIEVLV